MHRIFKDRSKLFCFTPEVMLITFTIEFTLALVAFVKYKLNQKTRICILTLASLGIFQLAEYNICRGAQGMLWAYIGFVAINLLPAFGLDFITLADRDRKRWVPIGYIFSGLIIFSTVYFSLITSAVCGGNYVIFNMSRTVYMIFIVYYLGLLFLSMMVALRDLADARIKKDHQKVRLYGWILAGYISFLLPTGIVYLLSLQSLIVPSVMCGFAIFFSFVLFFKIIPALVIILSHHAHHRHMRK